MNFKLISIEKPTANKHEYHAEYSLEEQVKTATLIKIYNNKEEIPEYKVILDEKISNGEFEEFIKKFIILAFQEQL